MRNLVLGLLIGLFAGVIIGLMMNRPTSNQTAQKELQIGGTKKNNKEPLPDTRLNPPTKNLTPKLSDVKILNVASHYPLHDNIPGELAKELEKTVLDISGGTFKLIINEPETLISAPDIFNAVQSGTIHAGFSAPSNWVKQISALQLFSSVPFEFSPRMFLAWFNEGGGNKIYLSLYKKRNIHAIICGMSTSQNYSWFRNPIDNINDFKRLRVTASGLSAKVLKKIGVKVRDHSNINPVDALLSGEIDGVFFSEYLTEFKEKLSKTANFYYFPEWHKPVTVFELLINSSIWKALTARQKSQLEASCAANILYGLTLSDSNHLKFLKKMMKKGTTLKVWPKEVIESLKNNWINVSEDEARKDKIFSKTLTSLKNFQEEFAIWRELSN